MKKRKRKTSDFQKLEIALISLLTRLYDYRQKHVDAGQPLGM